MCIIMVKNKGVELPKEDIIKTCFKNNSDGAGLMYQVGDYVKIEKGFMSVDKLIKRINTLNEKLDLKNKSLIIHFRIGTSGENDKKTTHPFPISSNTKELQMLSLKTDIGMVHNGIIYDYVYKDNGNLSDTQNYIKDHVSIFYDLNNNFLDNERVKKELLKSCKSKLAFLDSKDNITLIGDFITDTETELIFSNSTYKESRYTYYNYTWNYDDDYDYLDYRSSYYNDIKDYEESYITNNEEMIKNYEDLMLLDSDYLVQKSNGNLEKVGSNWWAMDKDNILYEITDFFNDYDYVVRIIDNYVDVYTPDYEYIDFDNEYDLGEVV